MIITTFPTEIDFDFRKGVPGDPYRYRTALEIPSVFGYPIRLDPKSDGCVITVECMHWCHDTIIDYVTSHRRLKGCSNKILEVCHL